MSTNTAHQDCIRCDRLADEARTAGVLNGTATWTSIDGEHTAWWESRP